MNISSLFAHGWLGIILSTSFTSKIILLILFTLLVCCLAMLINRYFILREHLRHANAATDELKNAKTLDDVLQLGLTFRGSFPGVIIKKMTHQVKDLLESKKNNSCIVLCSDDFASINQRMEYTLNDLIQEAEEYIPVFSVSVSISPLLGLLGTVLGLINAFMSMGTLQAVTIATIAPGVAEALVTTFAGLFVAIFALAIFYYLQSKIKQLERALCLFTDDLEILIKRILS